MDIKKYVKALPVVAALLFTASCSNEDNEIVEAPQPAQARIVPFTVTVNSGSSTRAALDNYGFYMFETTDKLWVWNDDGNIYGELTWDSGDSKGNTYSGTFKGSLTVEAGATLEASTTLYATIKSTSDQILGTDLAALKANGFKPNYYPTSTTFATSKNDAVRYFSYFKATSTYGAKSFPFKDTQNTSFVSFDITLPAIAGTINDGDYLNTTIKNGSNTLQGNVSATSVGGAIHAKFFAGFPSGALNNPTIKLGSGYEIDFGGTTSLAGNKVYKVAKTYTGYQISASATIPTIYMLTGGLKTKTVNNIELPYNKTLAELLPILGSEASMLATGVTDCTKLSGDNVISITGTAPDYSFSATAPGTATFKVTSTIPSLGSFTIDDLVITVAQVPVVTL